MLFADQRAHLGFAVERRAEPDTFRLLHHRVDELVVDGLLDQDAAARRADFALVDEDAEECAVDGGFEIGIGEKDVRRLAAQLKRDALDRIGRAFHDQLAHRGAAGEGDLIDAGMRHQRRAGGFAEAGDHVDHVRAEIRFRRTSRRFRGR